MLRLLPALIALALLAVTGAVAVAGSPAPHTGTTPPPPRVVTVPCGVTSVPYSVYSMPITHTETLTLTFQSSGDGLITFTANNFNAFYSASLPASCGPSCTLVLHDVHPWPRMRSPRLQLALDAASAPCPSPGISISNFVLQVGP